MLWVKSDDRESPPIFYKPDIAGDSHAAPKRAPFVSICHVRQNDVLPPFSLAIREYLRNHGGVCSR